MPHIFPDFNWTMSLYRPALELPETRQFRPAFVDCGDGTKKIDPMLACRVVVIKWIAQYTHQTRSSQSGPTGTNFKQQPARWLFRHFRVIFGFSTPVLRPNFRHTDRKRTFVNLFVYILTTRQVLLSITTCLVACLTRATALWLPPTLPSTCRRVPWSADTARLAVRTETLMVATLMGWQTRGLLDVTREPS